MPTTTILDLYRNELDRPRGDHYTHFTADGVRSVSTEAFFDAAVALSDGLAELGVGRGDRVLLLAENRPEWHQVDIATLALGAADVPIYPTLSADAVAYQAADSGAVAAVTENPRQSAKLLSSRDQLPDLRHIVQIEGETADDVLALADVLAAHRNPHGEQRFWDRARTVTAEDMASIVYTSGTTGPPKGVMLSHRNFTSNMAAVIPRADLTPDDEPLEFLPLSHVFERTCGYAFMSMGLSRTYCAPALVAQAMAAVKPTLFASVPRLFEKIHATIMTRVGAAPIWRRRLFHWAVEVGQRASHLAREGLHTTPSLRVKRAIADALVLAKIRAAFGGRLRFAASGGAPLSHDLNAFFHAIGIRLQEGYGLTETSPAIGLAGCQPGENRLGAVGKPIDNIEIRLADDSELLVRGPGITKGYWNRPEATAELFDEDGFLHTGDIAHIDDDGFLFITDRKKDLIIPAGGKNVAPQPIENALKVSPLIDNAVLVGDHRPYIVALLSPAEDELQAWAESRGLGGLELSELVEEDSVRAAFDAAVRDVNSSLGRFEQVKRFRILPRTLTLEDGYLTPTLKVRRRAVERAFADLIDTLYES